MYLVAQAQKSSVQCSCLSSNFAVLPIYFVLLLFFLSFLAAEWRNDARNPYAAQLAKGALH